MVRRILAGQIYDPVVRTPLDRMERLSRRLGRDVWLKREDLQPVFSFKLRGANNKLRNLSPEALKQASSVRRLAIMRRAWRCRRAFAARALLW
ncbi:MAG: pyridoxal-phosphate dependent enzyme [Hyphomonadaceae bacterium]